MYIIGSGLKFSQGLLLNYYVPQYMFKRFSSEREENIFSFGYCFILLVTACIVVFTFIFIGRENVEASYSKKNLQIHLLCLVVSVVPTIVGFFVDLEFGATMSMVGIFTLLTQQNTNPLKYLAPTIFSKDMLKLSRKMELIAKGLIGIVIGISVGAAVERDSFIKSKDNDPDSLGFTVGVLNLLIVLGITVSFLLCDKFR